MRGSTFGEAVIAYLRQQGWNLTGKQREGNVFLLSGKQNTADGTDKLLALVGVKADSSLTRDHVVHLLKSANQRGVDRVVVVPTEGLTDEASDLVAQYDVTTFDRDTVRSARNDTSAESASLFSSAMTSRRTLLGGTVVLGGLGLGGAAASGVFGGPLGDNAGNNNRTSASVAVMKRHLKAVSRGNKGTARELVHDQSTSIDEGQLSAEGLKIHEVQAIGVRALIKSNRDFSDEELATEERRIEEELSALVTEIGASDYQLVTITVTAPNRSERSESIGITVKDSGEWFVLDTSIGIGMSSTSTPTTEEPVPRQSHLKVTVATGTVTERTRIGTVSLIVGPRSEVDAIDLETMTIQWNGPNSTQTLTAGSNAGDTTFEVSSVKDDNNSIPRLDSLADRAKVTLDAVAITGDGLQTGTQITLTLKISQGMAADHRLEVPESLGGKEYVQL
jgi:archaellin